MKANPQGFHTTLTPEIIDRIIAAVPIVMVQQQIAYRAKISPQDLSRWLKLGKRDLELGNNETIFAQLAEKYHYARTEIVGDKLGEVKNPMWILERCFRSDFGLDSSEIKELQDIFMKMLPLMGRGDLVNGETNNEETE